MSQKIEVPAPFSPLLKLDLPTPEEWHKRKVALISGAWLYHLKRPTIAHLTASLSCQVSPVKMVPTCKWNASSLITRKQCSVNASLSGRLSRDERNINISIVLSFSTELLLSKGYEVHGIIRRSSSFNTSRLHHLYEDQHERTFPPRHVSCSSNSTTLPMQAPTN